MPLNLVIQTAFLGDLLLSIPLLKRCKELWPDQKLALVCRKGFGDFFLKTGAVDQVFEIQKGKQETYDAILSQLKDVKVQNLISPHESVRTAFFVSKIKAERKISYRNFWNIVFFNERIHRNKHLPDALRQLSLLCCQDGELRDNLKSYVKNERPFTPNKDNRLTAPPAWGSMSLRSAVLSQTETYTNLLSKFNLQAFENQNVVLIFPGSVWATKRWTEEGFVNAGKALQKKGYRIILMGAGGEEALAEKVAKQIPEAISLAGKTSVFESAQLIARARLVIGNDSASTHLASVCETPLIAVFGPTILEFGYRPWSAESFVVQMTELACRPCGKHGHRECPIGSHVCMKGISAETVLATAGFILR